MSLHPDRIWQMTWLLNPADKKLKLSFFDSLFIEDINFTAHALICRRSAQGRSQGMVLGCPNTPLEIKILYNYFVPANSSNRMYFTTNYPQRFHYRTFSANFARVGRSELSK
jgi:hypothetical protein